MKNRKTTRRALFSSVISLILCCAMLVGTTFAWFTDEVKSGINTITAGNLDVELYHSDNGIANEKVDTTTKLFDDLKLWEPGAVVYENFKVANEGNLALKYQLALNFANATKNNQGRTLADVLKVAVVSDEEGYPNGFTGDREAAKGLNFNHDLSTFAESGVLLEGEEKTYGVVIYWAPGNNDNDFNMNNLQEEVLSIDLGVELFATQVENLEDSFDNTYDKGLEMPEIKVETPTPDAFLAALAAGETAVLSYDLALTDDFYLEPGITAAIDLNGKTLKLGDNGGIAVQGNLIITGRGTIEVSGEDASRGYIGFQVADGATLQIDNGNIVGEGATWPVQMLGGSKLIMNGGSIDAGDDAPGGLVLDSQSKFVDVELNGGSITGGNDAVLSMAAKANIIDKADVIQGKIRMHGGYEMNITYRGNDPVIDKDDNGTLKLRKMTQYNGIFEDLNAKNHYTIESKEGLLNMPALLNSITTGEGNVVNITLMDDVNLAGETWTPIDLVWVNFNGNGHTISNLKAEGWKAGFIGYLCGGSIKNLTLENVDVTGAQVGAFAGSVEGKIENCVLKGENTITWAPKYQFGDPNGNLEAWNGIGAICGVMQPMTVNATIAEGAKVTLSKGGFTTDPGCVFIDNLTGYISKNNGTVTNNGKVIVNQGVSTAAELTAAVNNATDGSYIYFLNDIEGNATVLQKKNVSLVIDGKGYEYDGTIYLEGGIQGNSPETLTIKNVNFVTDETKDFISADDAKNVGKRYAHNVTIDNCTFTNEGNGTVVPVRLRQTYNITMQNCAVKGTFSPLWATGGTGITVDNVTATCTNEGVNFGTSTDVVLKNSNISVTGKYGFGVRVDANLATSLNVINSTLKADAPVVLRKATGDYTAVIDKCKLNAIGKEKIIVTASDYAEGKELTAPTGNISLTIIDTESDGIIYATDYLNPADRTLHQVPADYAKNEVVVPEGVTGMNGEAFGACAVKSVTIPASVKDFGATGVSDTGASSGAFKNSDVETVVLSEGMTEIPAAAFNGATKLTSVNIPASVKKIGVAAFRSTALTELTIPATVEEIAYGAFRDMTSLKKVTIEGDAVTLPGYVFRGCTNLREVYLNVDTLVLNGTQNFANASSNNPNTNNITFHVKNDTVAEAVKANMGVCSYVAIYVNGTLYAEIK